MLTLFILKDGFFAVSMKFILRIRVGRADNPEPPAFQRSAAAAPPPPAERPAAPPDTRGGCKSPRRRESTP
jgi:hypothetical protein